MKTVTTLNRSQTEKCAASLAKNLRPGAVLLLKGDLGTGKTTFVRGLARGLGIRRADPVRSPTFALIHEHPGKKPLCHVDLYRLDPEDCESLGLEEYLAPAAEPNWIVAIEWAERAETWIRRRVERERILNIRFTSISESRRKIEFS